MRILSSLILGAAALASTPSLADTLTAAQILTQFNGIITKQFSSQSDVEGRLVTGELKLGATFYNKPNGSTSSFAAVNAITIDSGHSMNVDNGASVNYQTSNAGHFNYFEDATSISLRGWTGSILAGKATVSDGATGA